MIRCLLALIAVMAAPVVARAQVAECSDAGALLADASRLYDAGRLDAALAIYQRCHRDTGRAEFAINSAVVLLKLGRKVEGANLLEQALAGQDVPADKRAALEATLDQLQTELGRIRVTNVSPGTITIDGEVVAHNARHASRLVEPGWHEVGWATSTQRDSQRVTVDAASAVSIVFSGKANPARQPATAQPAPSPERESARWTVAARLDLAPLDAGGVGVLGAAARASERWRVGLSGLVGSRVGVEAEVAFAVVAAGHWRVHAIAAGPVFWDEGLYPCGRGAGAVELRFGAWSFELGVGAAYALRAPATLDRLTELASFSVGRAL